MKSVLTLTLWAAILSAPLAQAAVQYAHSDHLGSTNSATDASGTVQQIETYTPFGERVFEKAPTVLSTSSLYTGQELDRESDLYNYGARYYDAALSRFTSVDPVQGNLPYTYVHNNPILLIDPDGQQEEESIPTFSSDADAMNAYVRKYEAGKSTLEHPFKYRLSGNNDEIFRFKNVVVRGPVDPSGIQYQADVFKVSDTSEKDMGDVQIYSPHFEVIKAWPDYYHEVQDFVVQHQENIPGTSALELDKRFKGFLVTYSGEKIEIEISGGPLSLGQLKTRNETFGSPAVSEGIEKVEFFENDQVLSSFPMPRPNITAQMMYRFFVAASAQRDSSMLAPQEDGRLKEAQ